MIRLKKIPAALRARDQWILWRLVERDDKPTKIPVQPDGAPAKSNDPATWTTFAAVCEAYDPDHHAGVGFVFAADGGFVGIDLDGCRDPETGRLADWAREVVLKFASYAEVSPSETGVKIFCEGASPLDRGRKIELPDAERMGEKTPAVEVYDRGRYFAVTGLQLVGPDEPTAAGEALAWLKGKFFADEPAVTPSLPIDFYSHEAIVDRARKYLAKIPPAVSGQSGHNATFHAACVLVLGFELPESDATALMMEWNLGCQPPWSARDIGRKVREAAKQGGSRGYLKNTAPANWSKIRVPSYSAPTVKAEPKTTTIASASKSYIEALASGMPQLASTTIPDLDFALGGGLGFGEYVIFAARPSHGKSAVAMQCLHHWTEIDRGGAPAVIISEEMSALMLGKRTVQHISAMRQDEWVYRIDDLKKQIDEYESEHAECFIVESCGTADAAVEAIERHVRENGVRYAVIDYTQLLRSPGKGRYEQITNTSITLRQLANRTGVVLLALCQLNRQVEQRGGGFTPAMSDLRDSGQLEQDADVISLMCWPHRLDPKEPKDRYQFFVVKNRSRPIEQALVECQFFPERQMFRDMPPQDVRHAVTRSDDAIPD